MGPFGRHQTASSLTSGFKYVTPINYWSMCIFHLYMVWAVLAASEATTALEDNWPQISNCLLILCILSFSWHLPFWHPQPWRSNPTPDFKSVMLITYLSMCIFLIWYWCLWGHYSLKTGSEVRCNLKFQLSDPNRRLYLCAYCLFGSLWGNYSLKTASEVKSDLRIETTYFAMSILPLTA